jgi:hypothetical protein
VQTISTATQSVGQTAGVGQHYTSLLEELPEYER